MSAPLRRVSTPPARVVLLLTVGMFINYIDRGNLATAAPLMQDALKLSSSEIGVLLAAFYYGYVAFMAPVGWMAERYGAQRVLAAGALLWSIATISTGFATGFTTLLILRVLLGVGESVAFPCMSKVLASTVEVSRLGVANGILSFGYLAGPAVGTLLGGYLMVAYGWQPVFVVFGCLSLVWLWPWLRVVIAAPGGEIPVDEVPPSFRRILRQRALWGASLGHFAANYSYYFILSWLPFYLVKARGFSMGSMAAIASWAYLLNALSALFMGWAADRWIRARRSADVIYKGTMGFTHVAGIACMAGMMMLSATGSVACLLAFEVITGLSFPGVFAIPQIIAGPTASARWVGVQNGIGNLAGLVAPAVTGVLVDRTGQFDIAFALAAAVNILGFIGWVVVLPTIKPIRWGK
jgi:MFS family permease